MNIYLLGKSAAGDRSVQVENLKLRWKVRVRGTDGASRRLSNEVPVRATREPRQVETAAAGSVQGNFKLRPTLSDR